MKTIAVAMAKGGTGKTTIAAALAVRAAREKSFNNKVVMVDLNEDQASLTQWSSLRDRSRDLFDPELKEIDEDVTEELPKLAAEGWEICILDTPPSYYDVIETAIMVADAVIVPVKTSIYDAGALGTVVEMCRKYSKPFVVVLSDVDTSFKTINANVVASLKADGLPLLERRVSHGVSHGVSHRASYQAALNEGKSAPELGDAKAVEEIEAVWQEAVRLAGIIIRPARSKRRQEKRAHG
jgi:chromosome partitioning protein